MSTGLWPRLRRAVESRFHQRVTTAGFGFSLTISLVAVLAFLTANNLLFLVLTCLLATLLISGFLSRLSLAGLKLDFRFPEHVSARRRVPVRMKLENEKTWMPSYSIHVGGAPGSVYSSELYFPMLAGGSTVEETVDVYFARRGPHSENSFVLRSRFPFGFAERHDEVTLPREVLVYPCIDPQPEFEAILRRLEGEMEIQARGHAYDFYRIRPYEHLESARHVDWRATAHTGELQVREFAREQDPLVEIFLDLNVADEHRRWFEQAVDCSAYLGWEVTRRGARLRFRTQNFDITSPAEGDVYTILKYLALVEPKRTRTTLSPGREDSLQVVFSAAPAPPADSGWLDAHWMGLHAFDGPATGEFATAAGAHRGGPGPQLHHGD